MKLLTETVPERGRASPVAPGIRRLVAENPGPMTYHGTNTYLIDWTGGVAVLDPGPDDAGHVAAILREAGAPVVAILLTHTHQDHLGAVAALREATGAALHGWHDPADPAGTPDVRLHDGDRVGPFAALHTPGHAPDHLCFLGPDGVTFSGDHVMGWSTTVVSPPAGDMGAYVRSLDVLLAHPAALYLPGHGPPLAEPAPFVGALRQHRRDREAALQAALSATPRSVRDLADRLYPGLDPSLRRAAERNVTAHLLKLRAERGAEETSAGWTR